MASPTFDLPALYLRHRDALHRVAASVLREVGLQAETTDVVQEAIASLIAVPPSEPIANGEAFLVRVVKNKAYDRIRAADVRHHGRRLDLELDDHEAPENQTLADAEDAIDASRAGAVVWDSLAILEDRERLVIRAVVQEGRPQGEVASELGISRPRVNQIMKVALQKLRAQVEKKGVER